MEDNGTELQEQGVETKEEQDTTIENESKSEKFIRLAQGRVTRARDAISRISHLANTSAYEYTPEQVEQMFFVLEGEIDQVKAQFQKPIKEKKAFSFQ